MYFLIVQTAMLFPIGNIKTEDKTINCSTSQLSIIINFCQNCGVHYYPRELDNTKTQNKIFKTSWQPSYRSVKIFLHPSSFSIRIFLHQYQKFIKQNTKISINWKNHHHICCKIIFIIPFGTVLVRVSWIIRLKVRKFIMGLTCGILRMYSSQSVIIIVIVFREHFLFSETKKIC